ncbi:hypothetical protein B5M42_021915 [Paenibacillus athensensis]|uniref:Uncharacterized protein n=1 Tax=Paenibacillus athensensis TaxID=1967502 RepID=A0A4Y8PWE6_9BACL|nr:hypothetical protein [Paenibacillus athensensis]MCD1261462.1 hypothetical protein [Paenibacillus athensensis]
MSFPNGLVRLRKSSFSRFPVFAGAILAQVDMAWFSLRTVLAGIKTNNVINRRKHDIDIRIGCICFDKKTTFLMEDHLFLKIIKGGAHALTPYRQSKENKKPLIPSSFFLHAYSFVTFSA